MNHDLALGIPDALGLKRGWVMAAVVSELKFSLS